MTSAAEPILISLVVAMGTNRVIGRDGGLPWKLSSDLKRFKATTLGKPVVMGRKTFASIGKPLPGRPNLVITRDLVFKAAGARVFSGLDPALAAAKAMAASQGASEVCVIGGAEIYNQALPLADVVHLTQVHTAPNDGDTLFPELDPAEWHQVSCEDVAPGPGDDCGFSVLRLERIKPVQG